MLNSSPRYRLAPPPVLALILALTVAPFGQAAVAAVAEKSGPAEKPAGDAKAPEKKDEKEKEPVLCVTEHALSLGGKTIKYRATAGYMAMKDAKGEKTKANIFFIAYTKIAGEGDPIDLSTRPLTFSFNGGPGSASIWLHMGALGPKRVLMTPKGESLPPPYKMGDNEYSWLDETDLVFLDPVTTGFSRAAAGEDPKQFHGFTEDIASVGDFIRLYTTRYGRWSSPKFLVGESYGTTRASGLSDYQQERYGLYLNGISLVSSIMNFQTARFTQGNDLPYQLFLPTYVAGAWYHKKLGGALAGADLKTALTTAEKFVQDKYSPALLRGDALTATDKTALAKEMAALIGLPATFIEQRALRIDIQTFTQKLLEDQNRSVGRYDCRLTGIRYAPGTQTTDFDPSYEAVYGS
jgi:carboxypeptidase C (cathepsin A)